MDSKVTQLLNAWADDVVRLETELADVRADNAALRETLSVALEQLHGAHLREQRYRERITEWTTAARERRAA
jgi:regulator of replication initiation timing